MKLIFILSMYLIPMIGLAQSVWEAPNAEGHKVTTSTFIDNKENSEAKYLKGAVPEVDGKVEWRLDIDVPKKNAQDIYDIIFDCFTSLTKTENQLEGSRISLINKKDHIVVASMKEWLVFTDKLLSLDRTKFNYTLIAYCKDNHLTVTMGRILYIYDEERVRGGYVYKAEEWINDKMH